MDEYYIFTQIQYRLIDSLWNSGQTVKAIDV